MSPSSSCPARLPRRVSLPTGLPLSVQAFLFSMPLSTSFPQSTWWRLLSACSLPGPSGNLYSAFCFTAKRWQFLNLSLQPWASAWASEHPPSHCMRYHHIKFSVSKTPHYLPSETGSSSLCSPCISSWHIVLPGLQAKILISHKIWPFYLLNVFQIYTSPSVVQMPRFWPSSSSLHIPSMASTSVSLSSGGHFPLHGEPPLLPLRYRTKIPSCQYLS